MILPAMLFLARLAQAAHLLGHLGVEQVVVCGMARSGVRCGVTAMTAHFMVNLEHTLCANAYAEVWLELLCTSIIL